MPWTHVILKAYGGPEELELRTVADLPTPRAGEVRVRVLVTSAAFTDVMIRKGMYPDVKVDPPFTPGYEKVCRRWTRSGWCFPQSHHGRCCTGSRRCRRVRVS